MTNPPPLQFDTAVPIAPPAGAEAVSSGVTCAGCQTVQTVEYFDVNGQSVCEKCRDEISRQAEPPGWGAVGRAAAFGIVAAILGAILYYAVIAITNFEIGIVAIAIGYMVGWAIRKATANRGGRRYQVLALVLTYWAVGLAYTPLTFQQLAEADKTEQAQTTEAPAPEAADSPDEVSAAIGIPLALGIVVGFSLVLPVLMGFGSLPGGLLSALIIGIGMQQAWKMTGVPALQISGPYRIAAASPPPAV